jgi:large subunit ribosomal protein L4
MPKKMRRGAICSALSERLREGRIVVVDEFTLESHKTKAFAAALAALGHERKTILVDAAENVNLARSSRNLPAVTLSNGSELNIHDVLSHDRLIFSRAAIQALAERLAR